MIAADKNDIAPATPMPPEPGCFGWAISEVGVNQ